MSDTDENLDFEDLEIVSNTESVVNDDTLDNISEYKDSDDNLSTLTNIDAPVIVPTKIDYKVVEPNGHVFINYYLLSHDNLLRDEDLKYFMKHLFMKKYDKLFTQVKTFYEPPYLEHDVFYSNFTKMYCILSRYNLEVFMSPAKALKLDYSNVIVQSEAEEFSRVLTYISSKGYTLEIFESPLSKISLAFSEIVEHQWNLGWLRRNIHSSICNGNLMEKWFNMLKIYYADDPDGLSECYTEVKRHILQSNSFCNYSSKLDPECMKKLKILEGEEFLSHHLYCLTLIKDN